MNVPILMVFTNCDKVSSKYEREQLLNNIQNELHITPLLPFSIGSVTGENINLLWQIIVDGCDTCIHKMKQIYEAIDTAVDEDEYYDEEDETATAPCDSWYDEQDKSSCDFLDHDDDDDIEYDQGYDWADDNIMLALAMIRLTTPTMTIVTKIRSERHPKNCNCHIDFKARISAQFKSHTACLMIETLSLAYNTNNMITL